MFRNIEETAKIRKMSNANMNANNRELEHIRVGRHCRLKYFLHLVEAEELFYYHCNVICSSNSSIQCMLDMADMADIQRVL